jgi:hypothetical protein
MKINWLIALGLMVYGVSRLEAYHWTVHNVTSSPIDAKLRLLGCLAHDPKQTIPPGEHYNFDIGGWSFGCCLKTDGLDINGKTIKHVDYDTILKHRTNLTRVVDGIIHMSSEVGGDVGVPRIMTAAEEQTAAPDPAIFMLAELLAVGATGLSVFLKDEIESACGDSDFVISEDGEGGLIAIQKKKSSNDKEFTVSND